MDTITVLQLEVKALKTQLKSASKYIASYGQTVTTASEWYRIFSQRAYRERVKELKKLGNYGEVQSCKSN